MGWFVMTALAMILVIAAVTYSSVSPAHRMYARIAAAAIGVLWIGGTALASYHTVENGHIGIVKQFGSIVSTTPEGLVTIAPWKSLSQVSVRNELRTFRMDDRGGSGFFDVAGGSAVSKDSQPVFLDVQVNYSLVRAGAVDLYRETGGQYVERILDPAVFQNVKEVTAGFKAIEFAANREIIRLQIEKKLQGEVGTVESTTGSGKLEAIRINNVSLKNVDFTDALSAAIEQTVEAEQQAKREQAKVAIATAQANQVVATAEGEARAAIAQAQGQATANVTRAQGDAKANKLRSQSLTPILVQQNAIDKLNPKVTVIVCPPRTTCLPGSTQVLGG